MNELVKKERQRKDGYLATLGVKRIVVVDDQAHDYRAATIRSHAPEPLKRRVFKKTEDHETLGDDGYEDWVDRRLAEQDRPTAGGWHRRALDQHPDQAGGALDILSIVFGEQYVPLDPSQWESLAPEALTEMAEDALVLFDRNLGASVSGDDLARTYRDKFPDAPAAILTSLVKIGAEEIEDIRASAGQVLVASKEHLNAVDGIARFIDEMRLTTVAHHLQAVREKVLALAGSAHATAVQRVKELDLRVLEDVMIGSSRDEGIFEADTLIRVLTIEYQHAYRAALLENDCALLAELLAEVERARVKAAAKRVVVPDAAQIAVELMNKERYAAGESINRPGLPLALGDIFRDDEDGFWMLLEPECDLQLRDDRDSRAEITHTELVRLASGRPAGGSRKWELPPKSAEFDHPQSLVLKQRLTVPFWLLDLAVFRRDGQCAWQVGIEAPEITLTPGVTRRFEAIRGKMSALAERTNVDDDHLLRAGDLTGSRVDGALRWPLRRVERLDPAYAAAALVAVGADRSRLGLEHDFAD